jgi:hypothetical protein
MFTVGDTKSSGLAESEGRCSRKDGERTERARSRCARMYHSVRSSSLQRQGKVTKTVMKLFGYREKAEGIEETIHESCLMNIEAQQRLKKLRATLDGEDGWFARRKE